MTLASINKLFSDTRFDVFMITALVVITRLYFFQTSDGQLGDADQAVFGMMAQKIAALEEFPIYCWEAHYAGTPVSYIAAAFSNFWGVGFYQLRVVMLLIILPAYSLFYFIYRRLFDRPRALVGVLFMIFSPYIVLNFTTAAYGGYGESFLGAAAIILLSWKIDDRTIKLPAGMSWFLLGLISGFFTYIQFYIIPTVLAFALPVLWRLEKKRIKTLTGLFCMGGFIGVLPLIIYNIMNGFGTVTRGGGLILASGREIISLTLWDATGRVLLHKAAYLKAWIFNAPLMYGQYIVPHFFGNTIQKVAGIGIIVVLLTYVVRSFLSAGKESPQGFQHRQVASYVLIFTFFQLVLSLKDARHFMPLFFVIPIALLYFGDNNKQFRRWFIAVLILMSTVQIPEWVGEFKKTRFDPRPVIETMQNEGIGHFYADYWTAYPIMFLGRGNLIGSPLLLPNNEPFADRRPQYTEQVVRAREAAFIFRNNQEKLKNEFLDFLQSNKITYKIVEAGTCQIYYFFSKPIGVSFKKNNWSNYFFLKKVQ